MNDLVKTLLAEFPEGRVEIADVGAANEAVEALLAEVRRLRELIETARDNEWLRSEWAEGVFMGVMDEGRSVENAIDVENQRWSGR